MSDNNVGYIYLRTHEAYDKYDAYKLGKASNIPERDSQYATREIIRGHFIVVYEVPYRMINKVERILKIELKPYNLRSDGGTEFFKKVIIDLIEPCFHTNNIEYTKIKDVRIRN